MSPQPTAITSTVHLRPSWHLATLLVGVHCCAIFLLWMIALPPWVIVAASMVIAASGALYVAKDALRTLPQSIVGMEIRGDGSCILETRSWARKEYKLLASSFVAPYLTVLNFKPAGECFVKSVVILPDSIDAEDFRRLRVLLRWKSGKGSVQDSGFSI